MTDNTEKLSLLKTAFGSYLPAGQEYLFNCPKCNHHKRKLSINLSKNVYKCWICEMHGKNIRNLFKSYKKEYLLSWDKINGCIDLSVEVDDLYSLISSLDEIKANKVEEIIELPREFRTLVCKNRSPTSISARNFLKHRGIDDKDIMKWKIGYCISGEYKDRIVVPSFSENGKINYFVARSYFDDRRKYKNPDIQKDIIFNHLYIDFRESICLVEGVFDAIKAGENSIPILGSTIREHSSLFFEIIKNYSCLYIALDPDARDKEMKIMRQFLKYGITIYKVQVEPYSDVGEMTKQEFQERKKMATKITQDSFLLYNMMVNG